MSEIRETPPDFSSDLEKKLKEIEKELEEKGLDEILKSSSQRAFEEEFKKLTQADADKKINKELNEMGSIEEVLEKQKTELINREIDKFKKLVDKKNERERTKWLIEYIINELKEGVRLQRFELNSLLTKVQSQYPYMGFYIKELIRYEVLDEEMSVKEALDNLKYHLIKIELEEKEED